MSKIEFTDEKGTFLLKDAERYNGLYFPIANESGMMSCVTPKLGGDAKTGWDTFILEPVSVENLHNNKSTRNFWLKFENEKPWSATGVSVMQYGDMFFEKNETTSVKAGILWHKTKRFSKKHLINAEILSFVPAEEDVNTEITVITLKNDGDEKTFTPIAAIPLFARSAENLRDHRHVTSLLNRTKVSADGVVVTPTLVFNEKGHRENAGSFGVFGFEESGEKPEGFYPISEEYIGSGSGYDCPEAIFTDNIKPQKSGAYFEGYESLGGIVFKKCTLKKGESKSYIVVTGYGKSEVRLLSVKERFSDFTKTMQSFENTKDFWDKKLNVTFKTGDKNFDMFMRWVSVQPILRRIYGCSFLPHHDYGRGGRGWRDLWQDCLALLIMEPENVREMLINNFKGVRLDGTNATIIGKKQGEFIADRNNISRIWMDHGFWPLKTVMLYLNQTGDFEILKVVVPYFVDKKSPRGGETGGNLPHNGTSSVYLGTILEHLLIQNLTAFYDVGNHNQMRLHNADWNDALDMAPDEGESVAFTAAYCENLYTLAKIVEKTNDTSFDIAKEVVVLLEGNEEIYNDHREKRKILKKYCDSFNNGKIIETTSLCKEYICKSLYEKAEWIKENIRKTQWIKSADGAGWFNGYYDNDGNMTEGNAVYGKRQMMLTSQVFEIMSGIADNEKISAIVKGADTLLFDEKCGGYRLNTDFKELKMNLGRMFGFAYGTKENGANFCHMTVMFANALYQKDFVKEGFFAIDTLYRHCMDFEKSRIYPGVPEYIDGNGRGMYSYLTGASSWLLLTVLTEMFGVKGNFGDLLIYPKLLKSQFDESGTAEVEFNFSDRNFNLKYKNNLKLDFGKYKISKLFLNGEEKNGINGESVSIFKDDILKLPTDKQNNIEIILG